MAHNREVALHVRREYVDTMGKVYYSYFKEYASKLMKLEVGMSVCACECVHARYVCALGVHWLTVTG